MPITRLPSVSFVQLHLSVPSSTFTDAAASFLEYFTGAFLRSLITARLLVFVTFQIVLPQGPSKCTKTVIAPLAQATVWAVEQGCGQWNKGVGSGTRVWAVEQGCGQWNKGVGSGTRVWAVEQGCGQWNKGVGNGTRVWAVDNNNDLAFTNSTQHTIVFNTVSQHSSNTFTTYGELNVDKYITLHYDKPEIRYFDQSS